MKSPIGKIEKRKLRVAFCSVAAITMLFLTAVFAWFIISPEAVAWFASNREVTGSGMTLSADVRSLEFSDTVTTVRHTGTTETVTVFRRDTDNLYYKYEGGAFVLEAGNKVPFVFSGILPGEYIDVTLTYRGAGLDGYDYSIAIEEVNDAEGRFTDLAGQSHSILGLYQICTLTETAGTEGTVITEGEKKWLATYNATGADTMTFPLVFKGPYAWSDETPDENGYVSTTFRLTINTSQYSTVLSTTPNMISEKMFTVNSIHIYFDNAQG